jgi:hypothetical protein
LRRTFLPASSEDGRFLRVFTRTPVVNQVQIAVRQFRDGRGMFVLAGAGFGAEDLFHSDILRPEQENMDLKKQREKQGKNEAKGRERFMSSNASKGTPQCRVTIGTIG